MMSMIEECLEEVKFVIFEKFFLPSVSIAHVLHLPFPSHFRSLAPSCNTLIIDIEV